jgi:hypothetical protein
MVLMSHYTNALENMQLEINENKKPGPNRLRLSPDRDSSAK